MEPTNQLDISEYFGSLKVRITGTEKEPLFSANDIIIKVLGYRDHSNCNPWKRIKQLPKYAFKQDEFDSNVSSGSRKSQWKLTERGLFELLCQSHQDIAESFKDWVFTLLLQIRENQLKIVQSQVKSSQLQLEEAKREIEELKQPKPASIYKIKQGDRLLYIGQDKSKLQTRRQQHLTARRRIANNEQLIDIYLASMNESDIVFEIQQCNDYDADYIEKTLIETLKPEFNQSMNGNSYFCVLCDPRKRYVNRGSFEKHLQTHEK